jgi:hypothetical protein
VSGVPGCRVVLQLQGSEQARGQGAQVSDLTLLFQHKGRHEFLTKKITWCSVGQLVPCRLDVSQARDRFSARQHRDVFATELTSDEELERDLGEWRRKNVLHDCD